MPLFKRKITYFYEHNRGKLGNTAGFLKLEIRGEKVKIIINIQETPENMEYEPELFFYHEAGDHLSAIKVGRLERTNGMLLFHQRTEWQNIFGTNRDLYTFDGVAVVYHLDHYYIGDFMDKNRIEFPLEIKEVPQTNINSEKQEKTISTPKEKTEDWYVEIGSDINVLERDNQESKMEPLKYEKEDALKQKEPEMYSKCENCPYQKKRMEQEENQNAFEKMLLEYPKLPMYGVQELMDCVRIHPKDIGKLDMRNWKLGVNSFLTHGFYTYQYLMLGKMIFDHGKEQPILGVPGVYSNREKYVANMFGFEQFIPIKKTGTKTGEFGYWIVELV